jgi:hypothetical protein
VLRRGCCSQKTRIRIFKSIAQELCLFTALEYVHRQLICKFSVTNVRYLNILRANIVSSQDYSDPKRLSEHTRLTNRTSFYKVVLDASPIVGPTAWRLLRRDRIISESPSMHYVIVPFYLWADLLVTNWTMAHDRLFVARFCSCCLTHRKRVVKRRNYPLGDTSICRLI